MQTFCSPQTGSRKMISGGYSMCPGPNGCWGSFMFQLEIWVCEDLVALRMHQFFIISRTSCPRTRLDDGQLLEATVVTTNSFLYIPISRMLSKSHVRFKLQLLRYLLWDSHMFRIGCGSNYTGNSMYNSSSLSVLKVGACFHEVPGLAISCPDCKVEAVWLVSVGIQAWVCFEMFFCFFNFGPLDPRRQTPNELLIPFMGSGQFGGNHAFVSKLIACINQG